MSATDPVDSKPVAIGSKPVAESKRASIDSKPAPASAEFVLTPLGEVASRLSRTPPESARLILAGFAWECSIRDLVTIATAFEQPISTLMQIDAAPRPRPFALPVFQRYGIYGAEMAASAAAFTRLFLADDYIETLVAVNGLIDKLSASDGDLALFFEHCNAVGVAPEKFVQFMARREEIMDDCVTAGIDVLWGEQYALATSKTFIGQLLSLKRCIYDALRLRVLEYDPASNRYRGRFGVSVGVPAQLSEAAARPLGVPAFVPPRFLATSALKLKPVSDSTLYSVAPVGVSVLDGYVDIDI